MKVMVDLVITYIKPSGVFTQVHTIHRADHVLSIFFDGIAKIPQIKVSDIYNTSSLFFYH